MIIVDQVSKYFGSVKAVDEISFTIKEGETLILLGTSGCGKTTTLRMINKLIEPSGGSISVNGQLITEVSPELLRRQMGYVMQHTGLFPHYTVAENLAIVPKLLKWSPDRIRSRALELIHKLHLAPEHLSLYPDQLSGGQQQRVGLGRALMANAPVLLLDEPFGALDPITRTHIREEFKNLDELKRKTMVMVTHDVAEAFALGDRICLMNKGKIEQIGTPAELLFHPKTPFVESFLQEQHLPLALKALPLTALGAIDAPIFPAGISVWEALTALLPYSASSPLAFDEDDESNTNRSAGIKQLLQALQTYRKG